MCVCVPSSGVEGNQKVPIANTWVFVQKTHHSIYAESLVGRVGSTFVFTPRLAPRTSTFGMLGEMNHPWVCVRVWVCVTSPWNPQAVATWQRFCLFLQVLQNQPLTASAFSKNKGSSTVDGQDSAPVDGWFVSFCLNVNPKPIPAFRRAFSVRSSIAGSPSLLGSMGPSSSIRAEPNSCCSFSNPVSGVCSYGFVRLCC